MGVDSLRGGYDLDRRSHASELHLAVIGYRGAYKQNQTGLPKISKTASRNGKDVRTGPNLEELVSAILVAFSG